MPEFAHVTPDGRRRILRSARAARAWAFMAAKSALLGFLAYVIVSNLSTLSSQPNLRIVAGATAGVLVAALIMQVHLCLARLTMRAQIMNLLRGERVPVCLRCGYDQSGNESDRCPECGASVRVPWPTAIRRL
ncbi:MAG TPA: hypothetical protein VMS30_00170 [Phycisphaerales bacterium]|nr:hypothetical protein [Phycisphaerales bacterium]